MKMLKSSLLIATVLVLLGDKEKHHPEIEIKKVTCIGIYS